MSKQERVVCAAIQYNAWNNELGDYSDFPSHICGINWASIKESHAYESCCILGSAANEVAGFMTSENRFVNPVVALTITGRNKEMRFQGRDYLLPEDLY